MIQTVSSASVRVNGGDPRAIGPGLVILFGVKDTDTLDMVPALQKNAPACASSRCGRQAQPQSQGQRLFGPGGVPVHPVRGHKEGDAIDIRIGAAKPPLSVQAYELFVAEMEKQGLKEVKHGEFGADMQVALVNEGPCTIVMDTDEWKKGD